MLLWEKMPKLSKMIPSKYKVLLLASLVTIVDSLDSENLPYSDKLDENYDLRWDFNETHIIFETRVRTNGYVGLGVSPSGGMKDSDIVIGWVKDGQSYFSDRHAVGNSMPEEDIQQDWLVLEASEMGEYTTLKMLRKLDTCDSQDLPIHKGTTRLIFSYHPDDPASYNAIGYHGPQRRGTKSIFLLTPVASSRYADVPIPDNVLTVDILNPNISLTSKSTTFQCSITKIPDLGQKHHMIKFEPVIQKGHEKLVHHMVLFTCAPDLEEDKLDGYSWDCTEQMNGMKLRCIHPIFLFSVGATAIPLPQDVGYSMGSASDSKFFRLETHYNNAAMESGIVDNSGFRLYLTKDLRRYDSGVLYAGIYVDDHHQIIPPYTESFVSTGYCTKDCLEKGFGDQDEVQVFAGALHSHLLGKKMRARLVRQGVELEPLLEDNAYDFNYQDLMTLTEERVLKKGDMIIVECDYDTTERTNVTYGGYSTREEMCLAVLFHYPAMPVSNCVSSVAFNKLPPPYTGSDIFEVVKQIDWTKPEAKNILMRIVQESDILDICTVGGSNPQVYGTLVPTPTIEKKYQRPTNACDKQVP